MVVVTQRGLGGWAAVGLQTVAMTRFADMALQRSKRHFVPIADIAEWQHASAWAFRHLTRSQFS
jgi:hypothetical protein